MRKTVLVDGYQPTRRSTSGAEQLIVVPGGLTRNAQSGRFNEVGPGKGVKLPKATSYIQKPVKK